MVSGIPRVLGLTTRLYDPHVYLVLGALHELLSAFLVHGSSLTSLGSVKQTDIQNVGP